MKEQISIINGFVAVDPIQVELIKGFDLINPNTGLEMGTKDNYYDHPYQAMVVLAPAYFYNGGIRYESEVKVGDVLLLTGHIVSHNELVIDGVRYPTIRYSDINGFYTPTEEQRKNIVFVREMKKAIDNTTSK